MADHSILHRDPDDRIQILDKDGAVVDEDNLPDLSDESLLEIYSQIKFGRRFDKKVVSLQRQGRLGTYSSHAGQEGAQVGSAHALADDDWILHYTRERVATWVHGLSPVVNLLYRVGHPGGVSQDANVFPPTVPIATHIPHATGMAWAAKHKGHDNAILCYFGDGATSEGDFHEGMNFAGVFDTPNIFFCNNNHWAISVPVEQQTASATLAQKAHAYGFEGVQVDGMDPLASYVVTKAALDKAKNPNEGERRPTMIEALMYRFEAHTTADDPRVYRDQEEVEEWRQRDPLIRLGNYLRDTGRLDDEREDAMDQRIEDRLDDLVEEAEEAEPPRPEQIFDQTYAELPAHLQEQLDYLEDLRERYGDEALLEEEQPWKQLITE